MTLQEQLVRDEGLRLKPYRDTVGKLTIGVGRNLEDVGISHEEAMLLLDHDIARAEADVNVHLPWSRQLGEPRRAVLVNMAFNLGIGGLLRFQRALAAMQQGNYDLAAREMLDSRWAEQVGARATRLARQMREGEWQ